MIELPGNPNGVYCPNCYSTNHTNCEGDTMPRENYTGQKQDLYDDLCAILRNYGYNDDDASKLMEVLDDE